MKINRDNLTELKVYQVVALVRSRPVMDQFIKFLEDWKGNGYNIHIDKKLLPMDRQ